MILGELQVSCLRNIKSLRLSLHPQFNIITGNNGSGKTTLLEALYLLSSGHSFRTRETASLLSHGCDALTVFARTEDEQRISIQKSVSSVTTARINGESCSSSSELAAFLPSQIIYQDIFQFIDAGPSVRRSFLDWGMFHVEQGYLGLWKNYRRALKQRNTLLRQRAVPALLLPWNTLMVEIAMQLDTLRCAYVEALNHHFQIICSRLTDLQCSVQYYKGWDRKAEGKELADLLISSYERDTLRQFTHYGPHQADMMLVGNSHKVKHYLSRGQQKMLLFALKFAQAELLNKSCIYLIDDMASELDKDHISRLIQHISSMKGQFFISSKCENEILSESDLPSRKLIHLHKGVCTEG